MSEDPFRKVYTPCNENQKALMNNIKDAAMELYDLMQQVEKQHDARCAHIARTRLEESIMWAIKGVTDAGSKRV